MFCLAALFVSLQLPTSQQVYDEVQMVLGKVKAVSFESNRYMSDAWEYEMGVSIQRPNGLYISGIGLRMESDGVWLFETGNGGTYLRRLPPGGTKWGYIGFESFFEPRPKVEGVGQNREITVPWLPKQTVWQISLTSSEWKSSARLFVDPVTKLPVGFENARGTYYYKNVRLHEHVSDEVRSLAPPTLKELLENSRKSLAGYNGARFSLLRDNKDTGERFEISRGGRYRYQILLPTGEVRKQLSQSSGKKVWQIRELFGLEALVGHDSRMRYLSEPELTILDEGDYPPVWKVTGKVPGSSKTIRVYYDRETWRPLGHDLVAGGSVVRTVIYQDLKLFGVR